MQLVELVREGVHTDLRFQVRWPERWRPGKHDLIGSSHQLFHFLVVMAAFSHLVGLLKAFDYRHGGQGASCAEVS